MKIYSKYHDYYDSVLAYGIDDTVTWIRDTKEVARYKPISSYYHNSTSLEGLTEEELFFESDMFRDRPGLPRKWESRRYSIGASTMEWRVVGVAGKMYPVLIIGVTDKKSYKDYYTYCYNIEDVMKVLEMFEADGVKGAIDDFKKKTKPSKYWPQRFRSNHKSTYERFRSFFETWHGTDNYQDLFVNLGVPIITCRWDVNDWIMETNSNLSDVGFQKVMDPFGTYQEIEMFLSGVLGGESPPMAQVQDDKLMAEKKGFDRVTSFRKAATKRR